MNGIFGKTRSVRKSGQALLFVCCILFLPAPAQVHISSHPHNGAITAAELGVFADNDYEGNPVFPLYTAGEDGFIIKWTDIENGEHFQFSDNSIKMMAVHPNGDDIAVYETDGFSLNRLSVWNWSSKSRRFAKRLTALPSSLSYSAKGRYLLVGMSNMDGIICLDAQSGTVLSNKIEDQTNLISFAVTSPSENTCIMYSPLGSLIYTDLRSGKQKVQFSAEQNLRQSCLFHNNILFAGVKGGNIYILRADTGEKAAFIAETEVLLCTCPSDMNLYYLDMKKGNPILKMIEIENGYIKTDPHIIKTFTLPPKETPVIAVKNEETLYIGTKSGQLYTVDTHADVQAKVQVKSVSKPIYGKIHDIAQQNDLFYFLTENAVFKSSYENSTVYSAFRNSNQTNIETYNGDIILWSKNTKKSVQLISENKAVKTLFTPTQPLQVLRVCLDKLIAVEGTTKVKIYDFKTGSISRPYTGNGIQDVLLYTDDQLYAAKSAGGSPGVALVQINPITKETAAIPSDADINFSLSRDSASKDFFYGVAVSASKKKAGGNTQIFSFSPKTKQYNPIFKWADEDNSAFTWVKDGILFTNVGKTQIHAYDILRRKDSLLDRTAALPLKITGNNSVLLVLNKNGSISWYDKNTKNLLKNWYITLGGEWLEF